MTKTQNSLLNTPLRLPVTFLGAPRNPVPEQEIPPLPTPRVPLGSQRLGMKTTPLGRSPLLALPAQPCEKQPLQTRRSAKAIGWFANAFSSPDGAFCHTHAYAEIEAHEAFFTSCFA